MKKKTTGNNIKKVIISIAIALIFALFIGIGINTFYPEPNFNDFCGDEKLKPVTSEITKEECISQNGKWNNITTPSIDTENNYECHKVDDQEEDIILRCSEISVKKREGYCDQNYYCRQEYENSKENYNKVVFVISLIIGIIALVTGVIIQITSISAGLMAGGVIIIIYGTMRYWRYSSDYLRFTILGIVLAILIWIAYKKLNK